MLFLCIFALDEIQLVTTQNMLERLQIQMFNDFKDTYHKHYATPEAELNAKTNFIDNVALINAHNEKFDNGKTTFRLGISDLLDFSIQELNDQLYGFQPVKFSRRPKTTEDTQDTTVELLTCEHTNQINQEEEEGNVIERVITDPLKTQDYTLETQIPDSMDWRFALQPIRFQGIMWIKVIIDVKLTY